LFVFGLRCLTQWEWSTGKAAVANLPVNAYADICRKLQQPNKDGISRNEAIFSTVDAGAAVALGGLLISERIVTVIPKQVIGKFQSDEILLLASLAKFQSDRISAGNQFRAAVLPSI
jgi:hypothetical protein